MITSRVSAKSRVSFAPADEALYILRGQNSRCLIGTMYARSLAHCTKLCRAPSTSCFGQGDHQPGWFQWLNPRPATNGPSTRSYNTIRICMRSRRYLSRANRNLREVWNRCYTLYAADGDIDVNQRLHNDLKGSSRIKEMET